ncbi:MAG: malonyl-CoA decarboxylase [Rhodospirillaceae bacterium]|jgi:malonyl-CoA decarboxylase|nr:malonyl-CoA decarboxylase [Rhodospirillaceae bacterium]MBT7266740.1 malonyl-CoA decarboxylase [Rhodospirillaceae bacterium]
MTEHKKSSFWDRTLRNLIGAWDKIASDTGAPLEIIVSPDLNEDDRLHLIEHMQACLDARGGEVSARKRAAALGHAYLSLNEEGRKKFLLVLTSEFGTDHAEIDVSVSELSKAEDGEARFMAEQKLRKALKAPRVHLLTQFNALPEGVKFLVDMREELILWAKQDPLLRGLESDLKALLTGWFDVGFLELKQITWQAPASLLEKLFVYEAVHEIKGWDDLKNRLASDRCCFAFFHPRMPEEPLIFVWVALVNGIADNVQVLLDQDAPLGDPEAADSAIFYSISNAQAGLSGINFGNFLIKRVVESLSKELPKIKNFATLSPLPGFRRWLDKRLLDGQFDLLTAEQDEAIMTLAVKSTPEAALNELLSRADWTKDEAVSEALREPLIRLCAYYLLKEKHASGTALDSVAHFHLNNGARVEQLNWQADMSERGVEQSGGVMLNYLYDPKTIDSNHESYRNGEEVNASSRVKNLLKT